SGFVTAAADEDLEWWIAAQRARQIGARLGVTVALVFAAVPVPAFVHVHRQHLVARLRVHAELFTEVRHRRHGVRRRDGFDTRVELPLARAARGHRTCSARIETADDAALRTERFEEVGHFAD